MSGDGNILEYWTEDEEDDWNIIKLTDKELIFEDDEGVTVKLTGTR